METKPGQLCLYVVLTILIIVIYDKLMNSSMKSGFNQGFSDTAGEWNGSNQSYTYGSYSGYGTPGFDSNLGGVNMYTLARYSN